MAIVSGDTLLYGVSDGTLKVAQLMKDKFITLRGAVNRDPQRVISISLITPSLISVVSQNNTFEILRINDEEKITKKLTRQTKKKQLKRK